MNKKYLTVFLLLLFLSVIISAQEIPNSIAVGDSNWFTQTSGTTRQLRDVFFVNDTMGWAAGDVGTILKTVDGGDNWYAQTSGVTFNIYSVFFISKQQGWAVGVGANSNVVLHTNNSGLTWITQPLPPGVRLQSIQFINPDTGWAAGWDGDDIGKIVSTTNEGVTWNIQYSDTTVHIFHSIYFSSANNGWAVGYDNQFFAKGAIYATSNGGSSWFLQENGIESNYWSVHFADDSVGWVAGWVGVILKTTNGGASWVQKNSGVNTVLYDCFFVDYFNGWIAGTDGVILRTFDGGETWAQQNSGITTYLTSIYFVDEYRGWAVGGSGTILHTISGGVTFVENNSAGSNPDNYNLYQNYPNPFNPSTKIKFTIPQDARVERREVSLKVYDVLGKEVATLLNEEKPAGEYEVEFKSEGFTSGVYFYQLRVGNSIETKKMILIK